MAPDRYRRRRLLGEGGAGRVWLVEDRERPGRLLALKELAASGSPAHEAAFRREFATLACLRHPALAEVGTFQGSSDAGPAWFTLELIEGGDLVATVREEGPQAVPALAVEALRALAFLHDFDLLHRDLKPANLLVRRLPRLGCRLVVVDFGLALHGPEQGPEALRAGGTLPYLAPELFANRAASRRTDLYALGAALHEAVYGHPPSAWTADGVREMGSEPAIPELPPGYPPALRGWLADLLAADPERRPGTAGEALARLNEACGTDEPAETPVSRAARLLSGPPAEREGSVLAIWRSLAPSAGPRLVWLCGGPGSGKSRILRWLEAEAILDGFGVAVGPAALSELRAGAARGPTLLLLDDVHAASAEVAALLQRVAREGDAPPLQVVAAVRAEGIERPALRDLLAATGTIPTLRRVDLGRLDADGVRAMACRATGGRVSEERVAWLLAASEGIPARAESLLVGGGWERGGAGRPSAEAALVPHGRLSMIPAAARTWLTGVAVLRRGARPEHAAALSGLAPAEAEAASRACAAAGLAYLRAGRWVPDSGTLTEHLLQALDPPARRALHAAAARLLETGLADDLEPGRLAALWAAAGDTARAVAVARAAAEAEEREGDAGSAAAGYAQALRLLGRGEGRDALRRRHARTLLRAGIHAAAARSAGAAVRLARDGRARTGALALQALALVHAGRFERALRAAGEAGARAAEEGEIAAFALARKAEGIGLARLGKETEAIPLLEEAAGRFGEVGDLVAAADALHALAACRARLGDALAEEAFGRAIEAYRRAGADDGKARVGLAVLRARSGRHEEAVALLEEVRAAARACGSLGLQEVALSKLVMVAIDTGRLDRAIALAEQAADLALHLGDPNLILVNHCGLADARIRCGRAGEAVAGLRQTLRMPLRRVEPENVDYARMLLADAWMESGGTDPATVRALLEQTLARCRKRRKHRVWQMALVIEMERRARADAAEPFPPVRAELDALLVAGVGADAEIRVRAALATASSRLAHGDAEAARARAAEAAQIARAHALLAFEARAATVSAEALRRLGRPREAEAAREEGRRLLARAAERIEDPAVRADFLARPVYATLRALAEGPAHGSDARLATLYDMIRILNSETDADGLLDTILDLALRAVGAERGMVLLREDRQGPEQGRFTVHASRDLESETVQDAQSYSRHVVEAAGAGRSLLAFDAGSDERFRDLASVSLYRIRSLMCVPLCSRGRILGTVYLDSRREGRLFTQDDLRFVEAFADQAALAIENTRIRSRLERQNRRLLAAAEARTSFANLVGRSPAMQSVFDLLEKVAATDLPVLIRGESGTGKELVARAIHRHGPRRRGAFLGENCAAIPDTLLESELFGHVRGAFTGADRERPGLFEQADGGTLFLDEVGDMPASMQARLLRVVEEGTVRRVGGERPVPVNVRLLTATHRDLAAEASAGRFRHDLLYRLQVLTIEIPPLRERPGDVPLLVAHFLERIAAERGRPPWIVDDGALALFERHRWPGNVRELQNTLQRLSLLAGDRAITEAVIASDPVLCRILLPQGAPPRSTFSLKSGEREQVRQALAAARGNRKKAAVLLGISRATLYRKLERHGL